MREGDAAQALSRAREAGAVLISEPLARRENIGTGGSLVLDGPGGRTELEVAGVYHDYGNERGGVFMDRERMDELFGAGRDTSVALYLVPGADLDAVAGRLRAELGDEPVMIRSHRRIRREALALFDQTFAITRILQAICLIVAICGVTLTLLLLVRSRISELALYRALGCSRWQIFGMFLGKGLGLALLGLLLGLAGGVVLALILVLVINPTYF